MTLNSDPLPEAKFGRTKETCARYRISEATLWRWIAKYEGFPKPIPAGPRVRLHDWHAIDAYLQHQRSKAVSA